MVPDQPKAIASELGMNTEPDDAMVETYLNDRIHDANHTLPQYKIVRNYVFSEEDMIKTTTLKIKRSKGTGTHRIKAGGCNLSMRDMNGLKISTR